MLPFFVIGALWMGLSFPPPVQALQTSSPAGRLYLVPSASSFSHAEASSQEADAYPQPIDHHELLSLLSHLYSIPLKEHDAYPYAPLFNYQGATMPVGHQPWSDAAGNILLQIAGLEKEQETVLNAMPVIPLKSDSQEFHVLQHQLLRSMEKDNQLDVISFGRTADMSVEAKTTDSSDVASFQFDLSNDEVVNAYRASFAKGEVDLDDTYDVDIMKQFVVIERIMDVLSSRSRPVVLDVLLTAPQIAAKKYGRGSRRYQNTVDAADMLIEKMAAWRQVHFTETPMEIASFSQEQSLSKRAVPKTVNGTEMPSCMTLDVCNSVTSSCSGRGACVNWNGCFKCQCKLDSAGYSCEKNNNVPNFHILFWTSLTLILTLIAVISTMLAAGEEK